MGDVSVAVEVAAPAEVIYDLVADLPRMGEWSPECERVEWAADTPGPFLGARFVGHNHHGRHRWSTHGTVVAAERGREFAFEVRSIRDLPVATWTYRIAPRADGTCLVTESTEDRRGALIKVLGRLATGVADREARNRETMAQTLESLRLAAEANTTR